jgi:P-type Mg2+ transporter
MTTLTYATRSVQDIATEQAVTLERGLTLSEVTSKRIRFGKNELTQEHRSAWSIVLRQLKSPFIYLLLGASLLAFLLGEIADALLIIAFISINTVLGFFQEYRSEQTLQLLKKYAAARARVLREGSSTLIPAEDLVPGDLVLLETGDRIPADLRLALVHSLSVDESAVTGESVSVEKTHEILSTTPQSAFQATNLCFAGTMVVHGSGFGIVIATGTESTLGTIAQHTGERHESAFEKSIARFSAFILRLVIATLLLVFLLHLLIRGDAVDIPNLLLFSIALAVGVIPEALPVVTTFSLSRGARKLSEKHVVVRRLAAVEDLGSIEVLCTDKTGTITENKLTLAHTFGSTREELLTYANRGADPDNGRIEPFDAALCAALSTDEQSALEHTTVLANVAFDPRTRFNAVVVEDVDKRRLIVRGAPEHIFSLCNTDQEVYTKAQTWASEAGEHGERVLAIATRTLTPTEDAFEAAQTPQKLSFLGIISFKDPIKQSTARAIHEAQTLGLQVKIVTGDSPEVAGAVAYDIGLIESPKEVLTGIQFEALDTHERHAAVRTYSVFARIGPEQKHEIVELLGESFEVGFLGEGINDVPALRAAGVSIVVESASDISRDTADIILLEKSLEVIVAGIREGRIAVANTSKYIKATLASSFGNFYAVALVSLFIDYLPMLPIQILLLNLVSDFPMIAIAADTVDQSEVAKPHSQNVRDILLIATLLGIVSTFFDFVFFGLFHDAAPSVLQTNWFIGSALTELAFLFSIRTRGVWWNAERVPSLIVLLTAGACCVTLTIPYIAPLATLFKFTAPSLTHLGMILGTVLVYFISTESVKLLYFRTLAQGALWKKA